MRYECDDPAFAGNYIEYDDSWNRRQVREAWNAIDKSNGGSEEKLLVILRPKIVSLHLDCIGNAPIIAADQLIPERTEEMDVRLYRWFSECWLRHLSDLADQGNALSGRLWNISGKAQVAQPSARKSRKK